MNVVRGVVRGCLCAISMGEHDAFITTPASSPTTPHLKSRSSSARRSLASHFTDTRCQPQPLCRCQEAFPASKKPSNFTGPAVSSPWRSLGVDHSELSLALSLPTGQSFRWKLTADSEYTGVVDNYLFTLRQTPNDVEYMLHNTCTADSCGDLDLSHATCNSSAFSANVFRTCHYPCAGSESQSFLTLAGNGGRVNTAKKCNNAAELACHSIRDAHANGYVVETTSAYHEINDTQALSAGTDAEETKNGSHNRYTCHHAQVSQSNDAHICTLWIEQAEASLRNYLNLATSLKDVWAPFVAADTRFAALAPHMAGARLLRQHPLECLFQFICSSNNHIQRISQMVDYLASLGPCLGTVGGLSFHAFPSLDILAKVTEAELRKAGFGYRAKYIVGAVKELQSKKGGGEEWLYSLRASTLSETLEELCSIPGIGPKVAACIALFSLDQHHAIPVDTHVWQIATTYIMPELSGERLTAKLHAAVSEAFVKRFGKYAGWAQNVLFIAELSSHQLYLPEHLRTTREKKLNGKSRKKAKI